MGGKVLIISAEEVLPPSNGGRTRTLSLAIEIARQFEVRLVSPGVVGKVFSQHGIDFQSFEHKAPSRLRTHLSPLPQIANFWLAPILDSVQSEVLRYEPDYILWSHSYVYALGIRRMRFSPSTKHIVDFQNIERLRFRNFSKSGRLANRLSAYFEYIKGEWWERTVAKSADFVLCLSNSDHKRLLKDDCEPLLIPNGFPQVALYTPSTGSSLVVIGSWAYKPNIEALIDFLSNQWVRIRDSVENAQLIIVGKELPWQGCIENYESLNVTYKGFVDNLDETIREGAVCFAPAFAGGGSQLKIRDYLSNGRVVVGPKYLEREIGNDPVLSQVILARSDVAATIVELLMDDQRRNVLEKLAFEYSQTMTWQSTVAPLMQAIAR